MFKRIRHRKSFRTISLVLALAMLLSMNVFAVSAIPGTAAGSAAWEDLLGLSARNYYAEAGHETADPEYTVVNLFASKGTVSLPALTYVDYVDMIALTDDGTYVNVSEWASAVVSDPDIVLYDRGLLYAQAQGETNVRVSYGGKTCEFTAVVETDDDPTDDFDVTYEPQSATVAKVLARAQDCKGYTWTPTKDLVGWRKSKTYYANTTYTGLPYSQNTQAYPVVYTFATTSFTAALSEPDFYTSVTTNGIVMPRYGLDCSAFLSYCIGINRVTTHTFIAGIANDTYTAVGSYDPSDYITGTSINAFDADMVKEITAAYASLSPGSTAIVQNGHCALVIGANASTKSLTIMEQTPLGTLKTTQSFSYFAEKGYLPFRFTT